jgi:hypothetical protein
MTILNLILRYLVNVLLAIPWGMIRTLDCFCNAVGCGAFNETISSRLGKGKKAGDTTAGWWAERVDKIMYWLTGKRNHCEENIDPKVGETAVIQ